MSTTATVKPSEILESAAKVIERDGWHQGSYFKRSNEEDLFAPAAPGENESAPCCQAGAISRAVFGVAWAGPQRLVEPLQLGAVVTAMDYARQTVSGITDGREGSPIAWNDEADRTKEDVVAMLRTAAEKAREAGE